MVFCRSRGAGGGEECAEDGNEGVGELHGCGIGGGGGVRLMMTMMMMMIEEVWWDLEWGM